MGATRAIGGLTPKERVFVKEFARTGNASRSTAKAYPNIKNPDNLTIYGNRVIKRPIVQQAIQKILDEEGLTEEYIAKQLKRHVEDGIGKKATASTSIKALEIAVKMRELVSKGLVGNVNMLVFQELEDKSKQELLDRRGELDSFFKNIIEGETVKDTTLAVGKP